MGLKFHECTINKSAHTKKVWKLIVCTSYLLLSVFVLSEDIDIRRISRQYNIILIEIYLKMCLGW